jgi:hypothetical protein
MGKLQNEAREQEQVALSLLQEIASLDLGTKNHMTVLIQTQKYLRFPLKCS